MVTLHFPSLPSINLWERAANLVVQAKNSPYTKWAGLGAGICLAAFAVQRVRSRLAPLDAKLKILEGNPRDDQLLGLYRELVPLRGHWFFSKRWASLKDSFSKGTPELRNQFCEKVIEHQISDPKNDWISPATELVTLDQLCSKEEQKNLTTHAKNLALAFENELPPGSTWQIFGSYYGSAGLLFLAQAARSFINIFLRSNDFSTEENTTLIDRSEAMMRLSSFYEVIGKPAALVIGIFTFLQSSFKNRYIPYAGSMGFVVAALVLIKILHGALAKKATSLSHDVRDLSEEAEEGKLPFAADRADEVNELAVCFTPLNEDSLSVLLVGPPGCGKDAIVHAFVDAIKKGIYPLLGDVGVITSNTSDLKEPGGGTGHVYHSRLEIFVKDLKGQVHKKISFLNEIHTLNNQKEGWGSDLGQKFKTFIERGDIHVVGATTEKEYEHIQKDAPLDRRFHKIFVKVFDRTRCIELLDVYFAKKYPLVTVEKSAIAAALDVTDKTSPEVAQPAKAKELLGEVVRGVIGQYGKEEKDVMTSSTSLEKARLYLKRDPTHRGQAAEAAQLSENLKTKTTTLRVKQKKLAGWRDLKAYREASHEKLVHLAHCVDQKALKFFLIDKMLHQLNKKILEIETALQKEGMQVVVDAQLIENTMQRKFKPTV